MLRGGNCPETLSGRGQTYQGGIAEVLCEQGSRRIIHCKDRGLLSVRGLSLTGALEKKRRAGGTADRLRDSPKTRLAAFDHIP